MRRKFKKIAGAFAAAALLLSGCAGKEGRQPEDLPAFYDGRQQGRAPKVKDQQDLATCWAFASLTALEASLLPAYPVDLSVDHMTLHNSFSLDQNQGGDYTMSMAYLLAWQGPVEESQDPYGDGTSPQGLLPCLHVQEIQILPSKDYEAVKRAVLKWGGVQSPLYTAMAQGQSSSCYNQETYAYCYTGEQPPNHDAVIIGWDDEYSRENFKPWAQGDGAFICTSSWGSDFGEQGYFYVSYYDSNIGVHNIAYTGIEPADNYSHIYQSDLCGWTGQIGYGSSTVWFANVYQAQGWEQLEAAGFYAIDQNTSYEVYYDLDPEENLRQPFDCLEPAARGTLEYAGYYTVPFDQNVSLAPGQRFAVLVKITTPGTIHPAAIEYDTGDGTAHPALDDGEGYLSPDGKNFERVEETQGCNLCLKAYTSDRTSENHGERRTEYEP